MGQRSILRIRNTAVAVGIGVALWAAWPSAQSAVGNFKRLVFSPVDARAIASNGTGAAATLTLTPTASYVTLTCNDPDGCAITMGETGIPNGMPVTIVSVGGYPVSFVYTADVSELAGPAKLGLYDELDLQYVSDRWVERGRKSIYAPVQLVASIHQTNAQIIAWPTTGNVEIVPASSGFAQVPLWGFIVCDSTHGNYANITDGSLTIATNNYSGYGTMFLEESGPPAAGKLSQLLASGTLTQVTMGIYGLIDTATSGSTVSDLLASPTPAADYSGNINLHVDNGGGNFSGGSGSNAGCDITVGYLRIKVPGL